METNTPNNTYMKYGVILIIILGILMGIYSVNVNSNEKIKTDSGKINTLSGTESIIKDENIQSLISEKEKELIIYQYNEEKLAHDLYTYFYEKYNNQVFQNIAESESKHMEQVKGLIDKYNLQLPMTGIGLGYGKLDNTYSELKLEGDKSVNNAFEVGIKIEMLDIEDIVSTINQTKNNDIINVLTNIGGASYNHLRGFAKNVNTDIDYSKYLSKEEVNSKGQGGNLKNKIYERINVK